MRRVVPVVAAFLLVAATSRAQPSGPNGNLPRPPAELVHRMAYDDFTIASHEGAGGGVMGASKVRLVFADGFEMKAKWKQAPTGGDGWNNSPRREVAAYAVQSLFLDPDDYVVPPVAARCIPLDVYRPIGGSTKPNLEGTACVFGAFSAWIENVKLEDDVLDRDRFSHDRRYAERFADLNLYTYLVEHRDARLNNFLISTDPENPQIFAVDNGIAFGGTLYNFFTWHLNDLHVDTFPPKSIERLRAVSAEDLARLAVITELADDGSGVLRPVPLGANLDPEKGTRLAPGRIQFGLTRAEIEALSARLKSLLADIDAGKMHTF